MTSGISMRIAHRARMGSLLGLACAVVLQAPVNAQARGVPPPLPRSPFQRLIAQGERPEIVGCMVAASGRVRNDPQWDDLRWGEDVSATAHVEDSEAQGQLLRKIVLEGTARERPVSGVARWHPVRVVCEQTEEKPISVEFQAR